MSEMMRFGLHGINSGLCGDPTIATRVAQLAEAAGFDSLWAGEHVVLPDPRTPDSPMDPEDPILDPVVALAYVSASTERVLLGTGVIILPQREPLVLAKELASLDVLCQGRLIAGIGAGYLEPELAAIGVSIHERGTRTDEYLAAMRAIWSGPRAAYHGQFASFAGVTAYPLPVQRPGPRVVVGGRSEAAYRRAVEQAEGWYGWGQTPEEAARIVGSLRSLEARLARPAALGPLEITVTPPGWPAWVDRATAMRYAEAGVDRLVLTMGPLSLAEIERRIDAMAKEMVERIPASDKAAC
jgi:probable F420-dependent oxidoreductase